MADITPINYYGMIPDYRGEALKDTQNQVAQAQLGAFRLEQQQKQSAAERGAAFRQDLQSAYHSENPEKAMQDLMAKYPEQMEQISGLTTYQDTRHKKATGDAVNDLMLAERTGNPQAVAAALARHADVVTASGTTPQEMMQLYNQNPDQFRSVLGAARMSTLTPDQQFTVEDAQQGRALQAQTLAENSRHNRASEGLQANSQALQAQMNQFTLEDRKLQRQMQRETNDLRLQQLQQKQSDLQSQKNQALADSYSQYQSAKEASRSAIQSAQDVLDSKGFGNYFGLKVPYAASIPGSSAADTKAMVDTLKSQIFLTAIQQMRGMGALSNAEGAKLESSISSLSPDMSEAQARKSIKQIMASFQRGAANLDTRYAPVLEKYNAAQAVQSQQQGQQQNAAPAAQQPAAQQPSAQQAPQTVNWDDL